MKISKLADYAVVLLSSFYGSEEDKVSVPLLASRTNLAEPTVSKVMKLLAAKDLVTSTRGACGGYTLTKPLRDIPVARVIEAIDGPIALTACVNESEDCCSIIKVCAINGRWGLVNNVIRDALNDISVLDMTQQGHHINYNNKPADKKAN